MAHATNPRKKAKAARGFTLVEVMMALAVFSIGILAIYAMQVTATNGNGGARKRTEAVSWAANQMEILKSSPYEALTNGQTARGPYNLNWTITDVDLDSDGVNDSKNIVVTASWLERGRQVSAGLAHVRTAG
jgi:type IV pilus modification protein PilV